MNQNLKKLSKTLIKDINFAVMVGVLDKYCVTLKQERKDID